MQQTNRFRSFETSSVHDCVQCRNLPESWVLVTYFCENRPFPVFVVSNYISQAFVISLMPGPNSSRSPATKLGHCDLLLQKLIHLVFKLKPVSLLLCASGPWTFIFTFTYHLQITCHKCMSYETSFLENRWHVWYDWNAQSGLTCQWWPFGFGYRCVIIGLSIVDTATLVHTHLCIINL